MCSYFKSNWKIFFLSFEKRNFFSIRSCLFSNIYFFNSVFHNENKFESYELLRVQEIRSTLIELTLHIKKLYI